MLVNVYMKRKYSFSLNTFKDILLNGMYLLTFVCCVADSLCSVSTNIISNHGSENDRIFMSWSISFNINIYI